VRGTRVDERERRWGGRAAWRGAPELGSALRGGVEVATGEGDGDMHKDEVERRKQGRRVGAYISPPHLYQVALCLGTNAHICTRPPLAPVQMCLSFTLNILNF
jgi:hypothetical protein